MTPLELAQRYMDIVFGGRDPDELRSLLAADLEFRGPLFRFTSADAYITSLKEDPPQGFSWKPLRVFVEASSACLVYEFEKPGVSTLMAQTFDVEEEKIVRIILVFDTAPFAAAH